MTRRVGGATLKYALSVRRCLSTSQQITWTNTLAESVVLWMSWFRKRVHTLSARLSGELDTDV